MTRFRMILEYDGTGYVGWQRQENGASVQAAVEEAVKSFCGEEAVVQCAGRTDSGVHARGQAAHVDIAKPADADTVRDALNHFLRREAISVLRVEEVPGTFHARFSAVRRHYRYVILNRRPPPAIEGPFAWWVPQALDADAMADAARPLLGRHDFTSFRASICQARSPVRTLDRLTVARRNEMIFVEAAAPSFLHNQVRIIVGTLAQAGRGRRTRADVRDILAARDRAAAGVTAPPQGLYLMQVDY